MTTERSLTYKILTTAETAALDQAAAALDAVAKAGAAAAPDLDKAATGLDSLDSAGRDAATTLDKVDTAVRGVDLDKLATEAKTAATKVHNAFDTMSKSGLGKVDDEARKSKRALDEMGDEAKSTGKEAAASFGGVEDALDGVQELAANAFAGFGTAGVIAGGLVAGAIGLLSTGLQEAADKANAAKDRIISLSDAINDAGGNLSKVDFAGIMRDWGNEIANAKSFWEVWQDSSVTNIEAVQQKARNAGIDFTDMWTAMRGDNPQATATTLAEINDRLTENTAASKEHAQAVSDEGNATDATTQALDRERDALVTAKDALLDKSGETEKAIELAGLKAEADGRTAAAAEADAAAVQAQADAYKAAYEVIDSTTDDVSDADARATKAAEKQAKAEEKRLGNKGDKWQDYAVVAVGSIDDVIAAQERDIQAGRDFQKNTEEVLDEVGQAGVDWANSQGENAGRAMQMLADAPKDKQTEVVANYLASGLASMQGTATGVDQGQPGVVAAATRVHSAAQKALNDRISIPVGVVWSPSQVSLTAQSIKNSMEAYFINHPVQVGLTPGPGFHLNGIKVT